MGVSDRVTVLDYGQKIAQGTPAEIFEAPRHERTRAFIGQVQRH